VIIILTPLIPLSFKGEGEIKKRGFAPLKHPARFNLLQRRVEMEDLKGRSPFKLPLTTALE